MRVMLGGDCGIEGMDTMARRGQSASMNSMMRDYVYE